MILDKRKGRKYSPVAPRKFLLSRLDGGWSPSEWYVFRLGIKYMENEEAPFSMHVYLFSDVLSLTGNLLYPAHVTTAFEGGGQKLIHDGIGFGQGEEASWHHKHVGVIVLACQMGYLCLPA